MSWKHRTIGELRQKLGTEDRRVVADRIRAYARQWNKHLLGDPCEHCGFSEHTELCHMKPIAAFTDNDLLISVNGSWNLAILCRNCHWLFDNGKLTEHDFRVELS